MTQVPIMVAECSRWQTVGVEGLIMARAIGAIPEPIKIPAFDGGPLIEAIPTRAHAAYVHKNGLWHCTAVTAMGVPRVKVDSEVPTVAYTWSDVDQALRALPDEVGDFVRRNQLAT